MKTISFVQGLDELVPSNVSSITKECDRSINFHGDVLSEMLINQIEKSLM